MFVLCKLKEVTYGNSDQSGRTDYADTVGS